MSTEDHLSRVDGPETCPLGTGKVCSTARELSYQDALVNIRELTELLHLPTTIEGRSRDLFEKVGDAGYLKDLRSIEAISSACVYTACRQEDIPLTYKEISNASKFKRAKIARYFKMILKVLGTSRCCNRLFTATDFIPRFCRMLNLDNNVLMTATHIGSKAVERDLVPGISPVTVSGAAIYMASQASADKRTWSEIAHVVGMTTGALRLCYKLMYPSAARLFPNDFKFETSN